MRKPRPRRRPSSPDVPPASSRSAVAGLFILLLLVSFWLSAPQHGAVVDRWLAGEGRTVSRAELLGQILFTTLLLPDEVITSWVGDDGRIGLVDRLPVAAAAIAILLVAWGGGRLVVRVIGFDSGCRMVDAVMAVGTGLHCSSLFVLAMGVGGLLDSVWILPALGIAVAGASIYSAWRWRYQVSPQPTSPPGSVATTRLEQRGAAYEFVPIAFCLLPLLAAIVFGGMLPPIDFDVREYHLQAPKEFYQAGRIGHLPHNVYANMPLGSEMFAVAGSVLLRDWWLGCMVGKTITAVYAILAGLAVFAFARRVAGERAGWVAVALFLSTPWILHIANRGLNENAYAFHLTLAVLAVSISKPNGDAKATGAAALVMAGVQTGAAVSVKYPAVVMLGIPLAVWIAAAQQRRAGNRAAAQAIVTFALSAALTCGPWLIKNAVETGNPVYPLATWLLPVEDRPDRFAEQWGAAHAAENFALSDAVQRAVDFIWRSPWQSPLLIALAVVALIGPQFRGPAISLWLFSLSFLLLWWLLTHRIERFWVPILPIFAVLGGMGVMVSRAAWWRRAVAAVLVAWLLVCGLTVATSFGVGGYARYLASYTWLRTAEERILPWRHQLNRDFEPSRPILSVGDAEVFDLEMPVYYNTVFDRWLLREWMGEGDWEDQLDRLRAELVARDIQAIYVHWGEIKRYRQTYDRGFGRTDFLQPALFDRLANAGLLQPVPLTVANDVIRVYRVNVE